MIKMKSEKEKYLERIRNLDRSRGYIPDSSFVYPRKPSKPEEPKYYLQAPKVAARDNYTCQWCRKTGVSLEVHHIDGNTKSNRLENLITVCTSCHRYHHSKTETKEKLEANKWRRNYYRLKEEKEKREGS